ncbi:hypothetical protein CBP31_00360 [Oceanisphaera profunda]|uniref:Uncharacterized protein n=1 Tax=Oceanisphaera profunda TaxID=1416627 RepID=A0A1Y0D170_9GAMM|nr:hypothetical protein CBP31_00360 [Oceanisphaera profunda]
MALKHKLMLFKADRVLRSAFLLTASMFKVFVVFVAGRLFGKEDFGGPALLNHPASQDRLINCRLQVRGFTA